MWENKEQKHRNRKSFGANTITSEKAHFIRFITTAQKDLGEGLRGTASPLRVDGSPRKRAAERRAQGAGRERSDSPVRSERRLCSSASFQQAACSKTAKMRKLPETCSLF